ncbi:MAG TPA: long-chain fatty acid--CoA ligase [Terriglobales bacterium]|nr:long-chain fatty acid--CoA ligase [Terriglobales bacterium]
MNQTINDVFYSVVERDQDRVMLYKQTVQWIPISSRELYRNVIGTARTLDKWGIGRGDRVAILSENRPEWAVADFASMLLGAADVPIYPTLTEEQTLAILRDSGARLAFVSTVEQLKKVLAIKDRTALEKVVVMDYVGIPEGIPMHRMMVNPETGRDSEMDALAKSIGPDDLATIVYTSGTTGTPKGVMLTHGNLVSNLSYAPGYFGFGPGHVGISFLPLSHVTARHLDYVLFQSGVTIAYCPNFTLMPQYLPEVRPTIFVGVPRVYEKIRDKVRHDTAKGFKRTVYEWATRVGHRHRNEILAGKQPASLSWKLANSLLYSKIRAAMGGRAQLFVSGGAPLGRELAEWFADIGIRIHEGYGLTETSPVIAINSPKDHRLGTVGKVIPNVECKIASDGEILVRGPSVFKGYWNKPEDTRNVFEEGWFRTGDIGHLDADGFLTITDRKKDLQKTSGGKFVTPQPIELAFKNSPMVAYAAVFADGRKFVSAVIAPEFPALEEWARAQEIGPVHRQQLVAHPKVRALYEGIVAEVNRNLAQYETIKNFLVVPDEFTIADGQLTASMKMRRRAVEQRYRAQIEALYGNAERSNSESAGGASDPSVGRNSLVRAGGHG